MSEDDSDETSKITKEHLENAGENLVDSTEKLQEDDEDDAEESDVAE